MNSETNPATQPSSSTEANSSFSRRGFLGRNTLAASGLMSFGILTNARRAYGDDHADKGQYSKEIDEGLAYFKKLADDQMPLIVGLKDAIAGGDLAKAKDAYVACRPHYEQIETYAASFEETDAKIDARPYGYDDGTTAEDFVSVHKIEHLLFGEGDLAPALPFAEQLIETCEQLKKDLNTRDAFWASINFDGMIGLANEISSKKISSEEETWSDQSLLIFWNNWLGIQSQIKPYFGALSGKDEKLVSNIEAALTQCFGTVEEYHDSGVFTPYSKVGMSKRSGMVAASNALRDSVTAAREALGVA